MNILVFDTETLSTDENGYFTYDIGYIIYDTEQSRPRCFHQYLIEEIYNNPILFSMAYYRDNRSEYEKEIKQCGLKCVPFREAMERLRKDIKLFDIKQAYAYNSAFDVRVFAKNCEFYKVENPLEKVEVFDIMGYANVVTSTAEYSKFCHDNGFFTESGAYIKVNEETVYRFVDENNEYIEAHTALSDAIDECYLLNKCVKKGLEYGVHYEPNRFIPRKDYAQEYKVYVNRKLVLSGHCKKIQKRDNGTIYISGAVD